MKLPLIAALICTLAIFVVDANDLRWKKPGCHKVGHKREIKIEGCSQFTLLSNACRGFCESYAVPAPPELANALKINITSIGQCCNMMEEEDLTATVTCLSDDGNWETRNVTFKSAKSCGCYLCKDEIPI